MLREFEKNVLEDINFANRYISIRNLYNRNVDYDFKPSKKQVVEILKKTGYDFQVVKNQFITNNIDGELTFRLIFEIQGGAILTYIFVLKNGEFINNGLSHFGYMLNFFDLSGLNINNDFGFNSLGEFEEYISSMISLFVDFKTKYIENLIGI